MNVFFSALRTAWRLASLRQRCSWVGLCCGVLLLCLGAGAAGGRWVHPLVITKTETKTEVKYQDRVQTVTVEKPVVKWKTRVQTVTIYAAGTTTPKETISTTETSGSKREGSVTKTSEATATDTTTDRSKSVIPVPEPRWRTSVLGGVAVRGGWAVGASAGYRLVGPLDIGAFAVLPLTAPSQSIIGLEVGLRF